MRLLIQEQGVEARTFIDVNRKHLHDLSWGWIPAGVPEHLMPRLIQVQKAALRYDDRRQEFIDDAVEEGWKPEQASTAWDAVYTEWETDYHRVYDVTNNKALQALDNEIDLVTRFCQEFAYQELEKQDADHIN